MQGVQRHPLCMHSTRCSPASNNLHTKCTEQHGMSSTELQTLPTIIIRVLKSNHFSHVSTDNVFQSFGNHAP